MRTKKKAENSTLLSVENLTIEYTLDKKVVHAVNGVSLSLEKGKTLGLVGETGAGKTTIAKSLLRILPNPQSRIAGGKIVFEGEDILALPDLAMRSIRGEKISMIFQDPMTSLNPVMKISDQIAEVVLLHTKLDKAGSHKRAIEMLEMVGISMDRADEYPHQFSGGMKQRVVIAMALACTPELLLADEPTTALDVTIQAQVIDLINNLKKEYNTSLIMITHDLGVVAEVCDDVAVIYAGKIVEYGSKEEIFDHPVHPYTKGLFDSLPDLAKDVSRLNPIKGLPPDPTNLPPGCSFAPRCLYAKEACNKGEVEIKPLEGSGHHQCRCLVFTK